MKNGHIDFKGFNELFSVLKKYNKSYVKFFAKIGVGEKVGETFIQGILEINSTNNSAAVIIVKGNEYTVKIEFKDGTFVQAYQHNVHIAKYELLDFYIELVFQERVISRGWKPSDDIYYPSDSDKTQELSIRESEFHKKVREIILANTGAEIKLWILAFDEKPRKVKERLHGEIEEDLNLKGYYFQGTVNPQDGGIPTIKTKKGKISISYHAYIGAPMIMTYYSQEQIMISDLYIEVNGKIIQPKNLNPDHFVWEKV